MEGVDYAFSSPSPAGLYAAGKRFAMRYVGPGSLSKLLTTAEARDICAAGLSIVLLVEGAADSAKAGRLLGRTHARQALEMCRNRGFPTDRPMYFAVDYDVDVASWPAAREYLDGAGDVLGPGMVGVYGEYDVMRWAAQARAASWFFQTYAWSRKPGTTTVQWWPGNHVEQYSNGARLAGGEVDLCRSKQPDFGQWTLGGDDVSKADVRQAVLELMAEGAARSTQDGRNFANRWYALTQGGVPDVTAKLDAILAAALNDGDTTVTMDPAAVAQLQQAIADLRAGVKADLAAAAHAEADALDAG